MTGDGGPSRRCGGLRGGGHQTYTAWLPRVAPPYWAAIRSTAGCGYTRRSAALASSVGLRVQFSNGARASTASSAVAWPARSRMTARSSGSGMVGGAGTWMIAHDSRTQGSRTMTRPGIGAHAVSPVAFWRLVLRFSGMVNWLRSCAFKALAPAAPAHGAPPACRAVPVGLGDRLGQGRPGAHAARSRASWWRCFLPARRSWRDVGSQAMEISPSSVSLPACRA